MAVEAQNGSFCLSYAPGYNLCLANLVIVLNFQPLCATPSSYWP
jgi:hypothetical protein